MGTRLIRVDDEVYAAVLMARGKLEAATGGWVPIGRACAFLVALSQMGRVTA